MPPVKSGRMKPSRGRQTGIRVMRASPGAEGPFFIGEITDHSSDARGEFLYQGGKDNDPFSPGQSRSFRQIEYRDFTFPLEVFLTYRPEIFYSQGGAGA